MPPAPQILRGLLHTVALVCVHLSLEPPATFVHGDLRKPSVTIEAGLSTHHAYCRDGPEAAGVPRIKESRHAGLVGTTPLPRTRLRLQRAKED